MSNRVQAALVVFLLASTTTGAERTVFPGKQWEPRKPDAVGLDAEKLDAFARRVGGDGVIVRYGNLVKTWGDPARRRDWASSCKPVISTLLWFAVHEGKLEGVDDLVRPWVAKRWPGKDLIEKDRTMTFRHLADMISGYARAERPGTHWGYNDYAINLYCHLMQEVFRTSLNKAALKRLAPLQFQDGELFASRRGCGVSTSPRDFARIGWFWLNRGRWGEKQLLPEEFFSRHLKPGVPRDLPRTKKSGQDYLGIGSHGGGTDQSAEGPGVYGFNWWFNAKIGKKDQRFMPHLPPDAYQANGHWGREVMLILPSLKLVVAARGNWGGLNLRHAKLLTDAVEDK